MIPAYGRDSNSDAIIDAKNENPDAELIVVINPSSGLGSGKDATEKA